MRPPRKAQFNYLSEKMTAALMSQGKELALLLTTAQIILYPLNLGVTSISDGCHTAMFGPFMGLIVKPHNSKTATKITSEIEMRKS